jgi:lipopolysaccharide export system permease protein
VNRLDFYLFRQHTTAFLFATAAVSFVVLFTQLFRLLSLVIDNSATLLIFFNLLGLSVPTFLPLVLPLALGTATIFTYHKFAIDSELVVMRAAGISPLRLATPAIVMTGIIMVVCFILTLWITPAANRNLVSLQYKVRDSYAVFLAHPGNFNDITEGLTFYARRRGAGGALEGILIHDVRQPLAPVTIMADTGQVMDNNGQPQIVVFKGQRQEMNLETGKLDQLGFDQYVLDLNALRAASPPRMADPREQTVWELLNPTDEMLKMRTTHDHLMAELNQRLASPFLALAYALIALASILAGEFNRRGMGKRILLASTAIIVTQACFMAMVSAVARHEWLAPMLYMTAFIPSVISFALINADFMRQYLPHLRQSLTVAP